MYDQYLQILADCLKDIYQDMTKSKVINLNIQETPQVINNFPISKIVQYEDFSHKVKGNFILGFSSEAMATRVASLIAENMGLPPVREFDELASDVLNEFMNTVIGRAISGWDRLGFQVKFGLPVSVNSSNLEKQLFPYRKAYKIIMYLSWEQTAWSVTFSEHNLARGVDRRILVVDDSKLIRLMLAKTLKEAGFSVAQAQDGQDAVAIFRDFHPDLTIMDINMPRLSGLDAIMAIREFDPQARFIMLTSSSRTDEVVTAKTLNVLSYLLKPVDNKALLTSVQKALG